MTELLNVALVLAAHALNELIRAGEVIVRPLRPHGRVAAGLPRAMQSGRDRAG